MTAEITDNFTNYGLGGAVISALFGLIIYMIRDHKAEREQWLTAYKEAAKMADERQAITNHVLRDLVETRRQDIMGAVKRAVKVEQVRVDLLKRQNTNRC